MTHARHKWQMRNPKQASRTAGALGSNAGMQAGPVLALHLPHLLLSLGHMTLGVEEARWSKKDKGETDAQRPVQTISCSSIRVQSKLVEVFQGGCRVGAISVSSRIRCFWPDLWIR